MTFKIISSSKYLKKVSKSFIYIYIKIQTLLIKKKITWESEVGKLKQNNCNIEQQRKQQEHTISKGSPNDSAKTKSLYLTPN